jgi:F-type H+-transporting ATPase subunit epsilon
VTKNNVEVLAATFEWKEDIDLERAQQQLERRKKELADAKDEKSIARAKIRVKRELIRTQVKTEN